jgi:hypothetical protein
VRASYEIEADWRSHSGANESTTGVSVEKIFPRLGETDTTDNVPKLLKEARC